MGINYTAEGREGYLLVKTSGSTRSTDELVAYIDRLVAECEAHGLRSLLLDHRELDFDRKFAGTYDVALRATKRMSSDKPYRVALVSRPDRMEFARVYEPIGLGRGVTLKAFDGPQMASVWLLGG